MKDFWIGLFMVGMISTHLGLWLKQRELSQREQARDAPSER